MNVYLLSRRGARAVAPFSLSLTVPRTRYLFCRAGDVVFSVTVSRPAVGPTLFVVCSFFGFSLPINEQDLALSPDEDESKDRCAKDLGSTSEHKPAATRVPQQ